MDTQAERPPRPRYLLWINTRQFYLCNTLLEALEHKTSFGGTIYEPLAATLSEKIASEA